MCVAKNIKLTMMILNGFKGAIALVLFIVGIIIASNQDFQRAYGLSIPSYGSGLLVTGLMVPCSTRMGYKGTVAHNKFLLLLHIIFDTTLLLTQVILVSGLLDFATPIYPELLRGDCARTSQLATTQAQCQEFYESDRYSGFKLVWVYQYERALIDPDAFATLNNLQIKGVCCGYGAPVNCEEDDRGYMDGHFLNGIKRKWLEARTMCGKQNGWYPSVGTAANECNQPIDPEATLPEYGGCRYEMPLGDCLTDIPEADTSGCAFYVEEYLNGELASLANTCGVCTVIEAISVLVSCCYFWKRKSQDILPEYIKEIAVETKADGD